jgi:hypothetical protein
MSDLHKAIIIDREHMQRAIRYALKDAQGLVGREHINQASETFIVGLSGALARDYPALSAQIYSLLKAPSAMPPVPVPATTPPTQPPTNLSEYLAAQEGK